MEHLINILDGVASVINLNLGSGRDYIRQSEGFKSDKKKLRGDTRNVNNDIKKSLGKYGEQGSKSSSYQQKR